MALVCGEELEAAGAISYLAALRHQLRKEKSEELRIVAWHEHVSRPFMRNPCLEVRPRRSCKRDYRQSKVPPSPLPWSLACHPHPPPVHAGARLS